MHCLISLTRDRAIRVQEGDDEAGQEGTHGRAAAEPVGYLGQALHRTVGCGVLEAVEEELRAFVHWLCEMRLGYILIGFLHPKHVHGTYNYYLCHFYLDSQMPFKYFVIWLANHNGKDHILMHPVPETGYSTLPSFDYATEMKIGEICEYLNSREVIMHSPLQINRRNVSVIETLPMFNGIVTSFIFVNQKIPPPSKLPTISITRGQALQWREYYQVYRSAEQQDESIGIFVSEKLVQFVISHIIPQPKQPTQTAVVSDSDEEDLIEDIADIIAGNSLHYEFPQNTRQPRLSALRTKQDIALFANSTHPAVYSGVLGLMNEFIQHKRYSGNAHERQIYQHINQASDLVIRCLSKRPKCFYGAYDNGLRGRAGFPLPIDFVDPGALLHNYINYDEMQISALIGVHGLTPFINAGSRRNRGIQTPDHQHAKEGLYSALVGARFEKSLHMELQHMVIGPVQNTAANGYGLHADGTSPRTELLRIWAMFYGLEYFPSFEEALAEMQMWPDKFLPILDGGKNLKALFYKDVYVKRMMYIFYPFLKEADAYARACNKRGLVRMTGIGLGVWSMQGLQKKQTLLFMQALQAAVQMDMFPNISRIDIVYWIWKDIPDAFTWCSNIQGQNFQWLTQDGRRIEVVNIPDNIEPASPLPNEEDWALATCYAWDSNSYPGNEYWDGELDASGDPAAACCSCIAELQNVDINPSLLDANRLKIYGH